MLSSKHASSGDIEINRNMNEVSVSWLQEYDNLIYIGLHSIMPVLQRHYKIGAVFDNPTRAIAGEVHVLHLQLLAHGDIQCLHDLDVSLFDIWCTSPGWHHCRAKLGESSAQFCTMFGEKALYEMLHQLPRSIELYTHVVL